jgi:hypothetical protein
LRFRDGALPVGAELDALSPTVALPMERPLYVPPVKLELDSSNADVTPEDLDATALFEQVYVDPEPLRVGVRRALRGRLQIGLAELVEHHPIEQGLAELVTYLSLSDSSFRLVYDEAAREELSWQDSAGRMRVVTMPRVTFARSDTAVEERQ